jgi:hypothetical protein
MSDMKHRCQDCQKVWAESALDEFEISPERLAPGDIVPTGSCPECGAACQPMKPFKVQVQAQFEIDAEDEDQACDEAVALAVDMDSTEWGTIILHDDDPAAMAVVDITKPSLNATMLDMLVAKFPWLHEGVDEVSGGDVINEMQGWYYELRG